MSLYDNVVKLMDESLEERINVVVNEYAEKISKKHEDFNKLCIYVQLFFCFHLFCL